MNITIYVLTGADDNLTPVLAAAVAATAAAAGAFGFLVGDVAGVVSIIILYRMFIWHFCSV